tara:strand:- start:1293 stop:1904 length:612 start_codon:yes stop_codon:yes gene_type:complete
MILIFDTETSGLPTLAGGRYHLNPKKFNFYDTARIIEIGYAIYKKNEHGKWKTVKEVNNLIVPNGFTINNSHIHGIEHQNCVEEGIDIRNALNEFAEDIKACNKIFAYNINFDVNIVLAEAYRANHCDMINAMKEKMDEGKCKCIMELAKRKLELSHIKLEPLHKMLFKREIVQTHRALDDVMLTADVLFEITKKDFKKPNID